MAKTDDVLYGGSDHDMDHLFGGNDNDILYGEEEMPSLAKMVMIF